MAAKKKSTARRKYVKRKNEIGMLKGIVSGGILGRKELKEVRQARKSTGPRKKK